MDTSLSETHPVSSADFALELAWYEGRLQDHVEVVARFVQRHRATILARAGADASGPVLLACTKELISDHRSLHLATELGAQLTEVRKEIWIRGERGDCDSARIQQEWVDRHAGPWRDWRVREYLFVFERCSELVLEILRPRAGAP